MFYDDGTFFSDKWIPYIKKTCLAFLSENSKRIDGQYLYFKNNIDEIINKFHDIAIELYRIKGYAIETYNTTTNSVRLNYHLIAALYIIVFLECKPFILKDVPKNQRLTITNKYIKFPNEYFTLYFLEELLKLCTSSYNKKLRISNAYRDKFIKSLPKKTLIQNIKGFFTELYSMEKNYFY